MNNKYKKPFGFSLLELMIILAITALIVQFAIPSYQVYIVKARALEQETLKMEEAIRAYPETQK